MCMCITHITYIHKHTFVSRRNTISLCHTKEHLQHHCLLYQSALIKNYSSHWRFILEIAKRKYCGKLGARQNCCRRPFHSKYPNSPYQASTCNPPCMELGLSFSSLPMGKHERTVKVQPSKTKTPQNKWPP